MYEKNLGHTFVHDTIFKNWLITNIMGQGAYYVPTQAFVCDLCAKLPSTVKLLKRLVVDYIELV